MKIIFGDIANPQKFPFPSGCKMLVLCDIENLTGSYEEAERVDFKKLAAGIQNNCRPKKLILKAIFTYRWPDYPMEQILKNCNPQYKVKVIDPKGFRRGKDGKYITNADQFLVEELKKLLKNKDIQLEYLIFGSGDLGLIKNLMRINDQNSSLPVSVISQSDKLNYQLTQLMNDDKIEHVCLIHQYWLETRELEEIPPRLRGQH